MQLMQWRHIGREVSIVFVGDIGLCIWPHGFKPKFLRRQMLQARAKVAIISKDGVRHRSTSHTASLLHTQVTKCVPK